MRKTMVGSVLLLFALIFIPGISTAAKTVHTVKQGDNLHTIAKKYHTSVDQLQGQNGLKSIKLSLGQTLVIKDDAEKAARKQSVKKDTGKKDVAKKDAGKKKRIEEIQAPVDEDDGEFMEYRTKKGDTLDKIAAQFNVDKTDLIESNNLQNLKDKRLSAGQTILIPKVIEEAEEDIVNLTIRPLKPWKNSDESYMLVKVAKSFMGAPYKYGGNTVKGLDCSAYVKKIYEIFDIQLPRSARDQFRIGSKIGDTDLAVGDLVFFKTKRYAKFPTHVGIYIGEGNFIHSSSGHGRIGVKIDALSSDYYSRAYIGAKRVKGGSLEDPPGATTTFEKTADNS